MRKLINWKKIDIRACQIQKPGKRATQTAIDEMGNCRLCIMAALFEVVNTTNHDSDYWPQVFNASEAAYYQKVADAGLCGTNPARKPGGKRRGKR